MSNYPYEHLNFIVKKLMEVIQSFYRQERRISTDTVLDSDLKRHKVINHSTTTKNLVTDL